MKKQWLTGCPNCDDGEYQVVEEKVFVVITTSVFGDTEYFGDILLITRDKNQADNLVERFNAGKSIEGLDCESLAENDGKAVVFERTLGKVMGDID